MSTYYKNFDNKTAIITGAASGLGAGIASVLAKQGANISLIDIDSDKLKKTTDVISNFGTNYKNKDRRKNFIPKVKTDGKKRKVWLHQFVHFFGNEAWIPI